MLAYNMQSPLPVNGDNKPAGKSVFYETTKRDFYHISFASECQICFGTSENPRRLPCEHEFCKKCLQEYFDELGNEDSRNYFPCPSCNQSIPKPRLSRSKWTKCYKIDNSGQTKFYTGGADLTDSCGDSPTKTKSSPPVLRRRQALSSAKVQGSRRTAVRFQDSNCENFDTKTSSDAKNCTYWGGDVSPDGDVILPDWYNKAVKVFSKNGHFVASTQLNYPPLDVTLITDNIIVVSFGSVAKRVDFLQLVGSTLLLIGSIPLKGYMYSSTRCGKRCLAIYEHENNSITLATVSHTRVVNILNIGETATCLSTASGITYSKDGKKIYCSEKKNLICIDSSGNRVFDKSYPYLETEHYRLGSGACTSSGHVYLASDNSVLHMSADGTLMYVLPTTIDPYHILISADDSKLYVLGRNDQVEICALN